ncbi:MAG: tRNA guanosine(34) transglycosylase Tgt [Calditrichaeota bacterium]|nr:MAG: tRNA guanosine(34) transglycosylase Tgt [Calditrichota bacterium]
MEFLLEASDSATRARAGRFRTAHGVVETPQFMPVGTVGTVKTLTPAELWEAGARIILGNTYHLYLRPGLEVLQAAGGLHRFNGWNGPILTDSGGFQIYSLNDLRQVNQEGVEFRSHWDGSTHFFSPERVVDIQRVIGSDIMMVLDQCIANPSDEAAARQAHLLTLDWAQRSREHFLRQKPLYGFPQLQFGIVQGGVYDHLRKESVRELVAIGFDGYAIGGLAVGEDARTRNRMTELCTDLLPENRVRYLMGVGKPEDLLDAIARGVDIFDCVIPTRNARNGWAFTRTGKVVIRNARYRSDFAPLSADCRCFCCTHFTRAYLHHLFRVKEMLGYRLLTIHNVHFFLSLMRQARRHILDGTFQDFQNRFLESYFTHQEKGR